MEAMTLATKICLINNGVLQQYDAPLSVYGRPANLFVADFVGNPSINFVEARGAQESDGSFSFSLLDGIKAVFRPKAPMNMAEWRRKCDQEIQESERRQKESLLDKKAVEKGNKDEVFRYHIARVHEDDYGIQEEPVITEEDFVLAIRPEFLKLDGEEGLDADIYGAMPTGMESTVKLRVGEYLLTGVVFGKTAYQIGEKTRIDVEGEDILLYDRRSGKLITAGALEWKA